MLVYIWSVLGCGDESLVTYYFQCPFDRICKLRGNCQSRLYVNLEL